jgi:adiponectin receptor
MSLKENLAKDENENLNEPENSKKDNETDNIKAFEEGVEVKEEEKETFKISDKQDKVLVGKYSEAPDYLRDNEFIKNGYLLNCHTVKLVLRSLFVCSNETINVWSHLLGCLISIGLIIFTAIFIKRQILKELTQNEFENIITNVNNTLYPWSNEIEQYQLIEKETIDSSISNYLNNIINNTQDLVTNFGTKSTIINKISNFIENTKEIITKIINNFTKIKDSKIYDILTIKWESCVNKIYDYINHDDNLIIKGENIKRWPLFIMLSAAIVCFGCSSSFHWFSIYNKKLYSFLCRLDYAGITFLIPGSCYPPYFYFYYCELC